ncbi:NlpE-like protein [Flavobacterium chryseum]|uniref:copper resistance protein NlpE N-terminal domain-containing protein n=1 Tax=Flavobacterium sp. P3160 TaxID=2512113 RepID=UPI0010E67235|nr:copper resistance protein NlpE N-terminal domain-containing protein [Flavobacterium sp. P3160]TDO72999.1 NlpE-like protein [Flavobacterium sp. P3160]
MKLLITTLLLIFNLTISAQSSNSVGDYTRSLGEEGKHTIEYKLTLNQDGTFVFHSYSKIQGGIPNEVNQYGKGKWSAKDNMITFTSDKKEDFDEKYTLDFNNSKARFITKNPRDKTDKVVKTKLLFLESGIFWMQRVDIFKV